MTHAISFCPQVLRVVLIQMRLKWDPLADPESGFA